MPELEYLLVETRGRVLYVTLNRPAALNTIHPPLRAELDEAMGRFRDDPDLWVAILTGAGDRAFCAGWDLKWHVANEQASRALRPSPSALANCWKPVIAAVNGYAVGGGLELALDCDIVIAADHARFGVPEPRRGQMTDKGAQRLPRIIPLKVAMGLLLTGKLIDATEAYRIGLVNEVVPSEQLMAAAERWAQEILECSPLAIQATKQAALQELLQGIEEGRSRSYPLQERLRQSQDLVEGPRAFAEKRKPIWTGV
jgi:enoyl-CoA hydratase/carnithine racemase